MAPAGPWADLHSELLVPIAAADDLSLRDYTSLRGVCTAWRSAIEPPSYYPCLLSLANDHGPHCSASVYSLPMRRSFHLQTPSSALDVSCDYDRNLYHRARVVGSSNGRFAVAVDQECVRSGVAKFLTCSTRSIFVLDPRAGKEVELTAPAASSRRCYEYEYVHKVVFAPGGTVIVALCGRKYVAYIDVSTSSDKWTTIDVKLEEHLADLAFGEDGKLYCLESNGCVHVVCIPGGGHNGEEESAVVEPLPAAAFVPPNDVASRLMTTKNLFFCNGSLYQVWHNSSATVTSGGIRMCADTILVLRYDPKRLPCWNAVKDLGGCSVFIGKYNCPAVVRADGVPGVRADSVYWIDWTRPMVCDIATRISKPHVLPYGACRGDCWYFDGNNIDGDERN